MNANDDQLLRRFVAGAKLNTRMRILRVPEDVGIPCHWPRVTQQYTLDRAPKAHIPRNMGDVLVHLRFEPDQVDANVVIEIWAGGCRALQRTGTLDWSGIIVQRAVMGDLYVEGGDGARLCGTLTAEWMDFSSEADRRKYMHDLHTHSCTPMDNEWLVSAGSYYMCRDAEQDYLKPHTVDAYGHNEVDPEWVLIHIHDNTAGDAVDVIRQALLAFGTDEVWCTSVPFLRVKRQFASAVAAFICERMLNAEEPSVRELRTYFPPGPQEKLEAARATLRKYHALVRELGARLVVVQDPVQDP